MKTAVLSVRSVNMRLWLCLAALAFGCDRPGDPPPVRAEFGVFFGGQVQDREKLPLVLDRTRQTHGIRLDFRDAPDRPLRVTWEIEKPSGSKAGDKLVEYGEAKTRTGERRLEIPLAFRAGDRTGAWRVRVSVDERVVLDRRFEVVPPPPAPAPPEE